MLIRFSSSLSTASSLSRKSTPCLSTLPFIVRHNSTTQAAEETEAPATPKRRTIPLAADLGGVDISRPRGEPRDSRSNGPRREGQQPRREGRPNDAASGEARLGGQRYNNGPRRDGRPSSGMASGEARQGGDQRQRPNNGARNDNRRPQNQSRPRNDAENSASWPNKQHRRGERQSNREPRSDSKEELKAQEAAQAEQVFAAAYDELKQGKFFNVDLGEVEDIFRPDLNASKSQGLVKSKDSRALAQQERLADLRERAGDYSRYVRRLHQTTDVSALGPVGLADLVLSHRRGIIPAERDKAINVVQKLVGSSKGTTVTA